MQKALLKKKAIIRDAINKNISRFYFNLNTEKELDEDFDSDELENYSEDEIEPDVEDMLKEDNKKISYMHARRINEEMIKMYEGFRVMTNSNEKNLNDVQEYIKQLQQTSTTTDRGSSQHNISSTNQP